MDYNSTELNRKLVLRNTNRTTKLQSNCRAFFVGRYTNVKDDVLSK